MINVWRCSDPEEHKNETNTWKSTALSRDKEKRGHCSKLHLKLTRALDFVVFSQYISS